MNKILKDELREIIELVKSCPPNLQDKCFEILLTDTLSNLRGGRKVVQEPNPAPNPANNGDEITNADVAKRAAAFAKGNGMEISHLQKVFDFEEEGIVTIKAPDLKVAKNSQKQKRLALLIGVEHQLMEGKFDVPTEELREMCVTYGCYDPSNFGANLKNTKQIFAGFKASGTNKLSPVGKSEAAALIAELAS